MFGQSFLGPLALSLLSPIALSSPSAAQNCKNTPNDRSWPSMSDWQALNTSIGGTLLKSSPIASSCFTNSPFDSPVSCDTVKSNWSSAVFQAQYPEAINSYLFANNSCLPPGVDGYEQGQGCSLGGLPEYIVNATCEQQVATAMKWAADRNTRIVVKGTGHDLNGRSSGAYALSIWTKNFNQISRNASWPVPGSSQTNDVYVVGSGQNWGNVLSQSLTEGRVVTTGQDKSVGLGGYIQGGGHGPLSSTYGLAADQVLQLTAVTTEGKVLVANNEQNQDLFWALKGGGGGQYGVVTEYVIKSYPEPASVAFGTLMIVTNNKGNRSESNFLEGSAIVLGELPDMMDSGVAGAVMIVTGEEVKSFAPAAASDAYGAVAGSLWGFNMTSDKLQSLVNPAINRLRKYAGNDTFDITFSGSDFGNYTSFYGAIGGTSESAGQGGVFTSRLLGRKALVEKPQEDVARYLKDALRSANETAGSYAVVGLQGGPGVHNVPKERQGAAHPGWRSAYLHFMSYGGPGDALKAGSPSKALEVAKEWNERIKEKNWRKWSPHSGAYMNEGNPYDKEFKDDFYGAGYERLLKIKKKYDPSESLFVLSGVGSDHWNYDLDSGKLCAV